MREKEISKSRRFLSDQAHFANVLLDSAALDRLAKADAYEKVSNITQVYCDHYVIHSFLFITNPHANYRTPRHALAYVVDRVHSLKRSDVSESNSPPKIQRAKAIAEAPVTNGWKLVI